MKYLKIIGISLIVSVIVSIGILAYVYNYVSLFPVKILDERGERMLGVSVTELSGTDTMSGFPTVYNANLNSLNDGKMEISTTTLPLLSTLLGLSSVGTIGTGIWEGTDVGIAYGGTATSTAVTNGVFFYDGSTYAQDTANFVWDDTNKRLGIGSSTPVEELGIDGQLYVGGSSSATSTFEGNIQFCNDGCTQGWYPTYSGSTTTFNFW